MRELFYQLFNMKLPSTHLLNLCAKAWGLRHIVFIHKTKNIVYRCDSDAGKVYLRLTASSRRMRQEIEAEINWIEHLAKCGLRVPQPIPDRDGNKISSFVEGKQHFEAVVFPAIVGEHPSQDRACDPKFLRALGALIAQMHQASRSYEQAHPGMKGKEWFDEQGLPQALTAAAVSKHTALRRRLEEAVSWMQRLPRTPETYGLIHADLGALNLFIEEGRSIGIIDFDESCYHWFVFDLATVIFSMAKRFGYPTPQPEEVKWLADLIEGYRTVRPLSQSEVDLILPLIDFACLRLFFWVEYNESRRAYHKEAMDKAAQLKQWALSRISPT